MLLQTTLFLTLILAAMVLVVASLLRDSATRESLRAVLDLWRVGSGAAFLASAVALLVATDETTGSLLAGAELRSEVEVVRAEQPESGAAELELLEAGLGLGAGLSGQDGR